MRKGCILFLLFISLVFIFNCAPTKNDLSKPEEAELKKQQDPGFYEIYYQALHYISPELPFEVPAPYYLDHITNNRRLTEELNLQDIELPEKKDTYLEYYLTRDLVRFLNRYAFEPSEETIKEYYQKNISQYYRPDTIEGARFLIEYDDNAEETTAHWEEVLQEAFEKQVTEDPFRDVAKEYYLSRGLYDIDGSYGYFGKKEHGTIRDELFDLFFEADLDAPYFGPVETKHGYLFGKLYNRWEEGTKPFEEVKNDIKNNMLRERVNEFYDNLLDKELAQHNVEYLYDRENLPVPDREDNILQINDTTYTYDDILQAVPYMMGDIHSLSFLNNIGEIFLEKHAIFHSEEGQNIRETPEYQFLYEALLNDYRIQQYLEQRYEEEIEITEENLISFYETAGELLYEAPDLYKMRVFYRDQNPERETDPYLIHRARQTAWENINAARDYFLEQEDKLKADMSRFEKEMGITVNDVLEWREKDTLGRLVEMDIPERSPGDTSDIVFDDQVYVFYYLIDHKEQGVKDFEEVRERVRTHYTRYQREKIRHRYDIFYANDYLHGLITMAKEQR